MNPDLSHALTQFVTQATSLLEAGTAQLPAVLNDIVAYKLFDAWFGVFLGVGFLALAGLGVILYATHGDHYGDFKEPLGMFLVVVGSAFGLLFTLMGVYSVYYVTHFPRLVILDYLKGLL